MDFLDPKKRRNHTIRLLIGYVLIAILILLATTVLLYQAYGFGWKKGQVIQNGLIFVSSQPSPASVYLNGQLKAKTGVRMVLQAGTYTMKLTRDGYRDWQRQVTVEGSSVEHIDYPFLVPQNLSAKSLASYTAAPDVALQSPDRRWMLAQQPGKFAVFDQYDLKDPKKVSSSRTSVTIPSTLLTQATGAQTLRLAEWSNDNVHVLFEHGYDDKLEYILLDRKDPAQSVNLTQKLHLQPTVKLALQNKRFDHYFLYDTSTLTLGTIALDQANSQPLLTHVLAYKTYGNDTVLYVTDQDAKKDQVNVRLYQSGATHVIRALPVDTTYLLDLARYSDSWYVAAGAPHENRVYIYKDPADFSEKQTGLQVPVPLNILRVNAPNYLAFSANTQFIMTSNGSNFAVYDAENDRRFTYQTTHPLDAPQPHPLWMDGDRIMYVSQGRVTIFDYDGTNAQTLVPAAPGFIPFFDTNYHYLYTIAPAKTAPQADLTQTTLLTPQDQ